MPLPSYTALVCLLAIALYFFIATRVAAAHRKFGVKLPAMTGHPDFERTYRAHANILEWMPTFMELLWLCAIFFGGYSQAVQKRLPGFLIQALVCVLLFLGALVGVIKHLMAG